MSLIVVQRGHVPRTTGATGAPGEQQFAIEAAEQTRKRIQGVGHACRVINADEDSARYRGEAFFAIHYDSSDSSAARGASVGYQTNEGAKVGRLWKAHYKRNGWTGPFRGDNYTANLAGYYGVRRAVDQGNRFALIVEAGFHSNPTDAALLRSPKGPDRVAIAIAATVVDLFGTRGDCPPPSGLPVYPGTCQRGDHGNVVVGWQKQMLRRGYAPANMGFTATPDGIFGPKMETSIACWQEMFDLTVDGIAGPQTWHSLLFDR